MADAASSQPATVSHTPDAFPKVPPTTLARLPAQLRLPPRFNHGENATLLLGGYIIKRGFPGTATKRYFTLLSSIECGKYVAYFKDANDLFNGSAPKGIFYADQIFAVEAGTFAGARRRGSGLVVSMARSDGMRRFQLWVDDDETAGTWIDAIRTECCDGVLVYSPRSLKALAAAAIAPLVYPADIDDFQARQDAFEARMRDERIPEELFPDIKAALKLVQGNDEYPRRGIKTYAHCRVTSVARSAIQRLERAVDGDGGAVGGDSVSPSGGPSGRPSGSNVVGGDIVHDDGRGANDIHEAGGHGVADEIDATASHVGSLLP